MHISETQALFPVEDSKPVDMHEENSFVTEDDGFEYVVGAACRKYVSDFPYLGNYTYQCKGIHSLLDHDYAYPVSYVEHLSLGGLMKPTTIWLEQAKRLEMFFKMYHSDKISKEPNVVQGVSKLLKGKYPDIPEKLISHFIRHRTYIRINTLNRCLKQKKLRNLRTFKKSAISPLTKPQKKMKKYLI